MQISARYITADNKTVESAVGNFVVCLPTEALSARDGRVPSELLQWLDDGNPVAAYATPAPTPEEVATERARRLALGFDYDFADARGVHHVGTTEQDMKGWDEVSKARQAMIALGAGSQTLNIVTNTGPASVTALEWQRILVVAALARQPIWAASFALQAMSPIPSDYAADHYWAA